MTLMSSLFQRVIGISGIVELKRETSNYIVQYKNRLFFIYTYSFLSGVHCHVVKNKNANNQINKVANTGNSNVLYYKAKHLSR